MTTIPFLVLGLSLVVNLALYWHLEQQWRRQRRLIVQEFLQELDRRGLLP